MDLITIADTLSTISSVPGLAETWTLEDLWKYITLARHIRPNIEVVSAPGTVGPLDYLSVEIHNFLKLSLGLEDEVAKQTWGVLRDIVWDGGLPKLSHSLKRIADHLDDFVVFGIPYGIGSPLTSE